MIVNNSSNINKQKRKFKQWLSTISKQKWKFKQYQRFLQYQQTKKNV